MLEAERQRRRPSKLRRTEVLVRVAVVNIVALVISTIASLITIALFIRLIRDMGRITWRVVDRATRRLIKDMQAAGEQPDIVLGVGRGGAIVAGMLAGNLGHLPLFVIDTVLDRTGRLSLATIRFPDLCPDVKGKKVMVVVGELYSGEDLKAAVQLVEENEPASLKTASMFSHPAASIKPDYIGKQTKQPLSAPWRMTEVYRARRL